MRLINSAPAFGFDQPYEMLEACHDRVERSLSLLLRLGEHLLASSEVDQQSREAASDVLRYFDIAAPHHHEDEERHVLPLLRDIGRGELADRIAADHVQMNIAYLALRPGLVALRDQGLMPEFGTWSVFAALYRAHIALEEAEVYPVTRRLVKSDDLAAMGAEMATRRRSG